MNDFELEYESADWSVASFQAIGDWEGFEDSFDSMDSQMTSGEAEDFLENEFGLEGDLEVLPVAIPVLAKALATAMPAILKAAPGLAKAFQRRPRQYSAPRPASPAVALAPVRPAQPRPVRAQAATQPAGMLLGLLRNPAVTAGLQDLAAGAGGNISVGKTKIPISSILGIVSQLASRAGAAFGKEDFYYPEYYFDTEGNMLVNPESPESIAEHILNIINH